MKKEIVDVSNKTGRDDILEAGFNVLANHEFHRISDEVIEEVGIPMSSRVFPAWQQWLNEEVKRRHI
jgi:hypothetical protein